jgi:hypothetical protein
LLSPEAEIQESDRVATGRFRTASEIRDWMAQQYGASYTVGGVYSLLKRLKCGPPRGAPSGPRQGRWGIAGSLEKGVFSKPWPERE